VFPLGDDDGGQAVADDVDASAGGIGELVDAEERGEAMGAASSSLRQRQ